MNKLLCFIGLHQWVYNQDNTKRGVDIVTKHKNIGVTVCGLNALMVNQ